MSSPEERGFYSSPEGDYPGHLPSYWKDFSDGTITTDLFNLTDDELIKLGWTGPIEMPPFPGTSFYTHSFTWNSETKEFEVTELPDYEKFSRINYRLFWSELIDSSAYSTIKLYAEESLKINTISTEFIALLTDAKNGFPIEEKIQESLTEIITNVPFTQEELEEIQNIFISSGMFAVYTLQ